MKTDYDDLCGWWKAHGWEPVPEMLLPWGWIVEDDGKKLCAGFLFIAMNAPVGYLEYVVSNPDNTAKQSYKAIDMLLGEICTFAKYNMILAMFAKLTVRSLEKMYNRHGFKSGDASIKDMVWH
jgi:hypothetical protein